MIDIERDPSAPAGLSDRDLRAPDVLEALHRCFLGKCYLCERSVTLSSFHVEHRVPRGHDNTREHDWTNLFPCCEGCNLRRKKGYPDGGLLDPAGGQAIESRLEQRIADWPGADPKPYFAARDPSDLAAVNTAAELDRIHNDDSNSLKAADLRHAILTHQRRVFRQCLYYLHNTAISEHARQEVRTHLRLLLSRRAPYTALTRAELIPLGPDIVALFD